MKFAKLFGVNPPRTNRLKLRSELRDLAPEQKATLYFFYSEFLLRANRNQSYKEALNRATYSAIDGRGLHWSFWRILSLGILPQIHRTLITKIPAWARPIYFYPALLAQLLWNVVLSSLCLITRWNLTKRTGNELVLGRDFSYDLLTLAEENRWKTLIIGGTTDNNQTTRNLLEKLYPQLEFDIWSRAYNSKLMRDEPADGQKLNQLNANNLYKYFPDLLEAKNYAQLYRPDLILVCLGGASGKQEFLIDDLYCDNHITFTLATGIGAALDHLGGGAKQNRTPKWLELSGLEWLYRFFVLPYRRKRILDSIFTLWWWTTLQEFMNTGKTSHQFVNLIASDDGKFLVEQKDGQTEFLLSPVSRQDSIKKNYLRTKKITGLDFKLIDFDPKPVKLLTESVPTTLRNFQKHLLKYDSVEPFLSIVHYHHVATQNILPTNLAWLTPQELEQKLSYNHQKYWRAYRFLSREKPE